MEQGQAVPQPADAKATAGSLEQVLQHMAGHLVDADAQLKGMRSLQMFLDFGPKQQLLICRAKGGEAIIAAMKAHNSDAELQAHAALTLSSLAQACPETQSALLDAGAVEATVAAMRNYEDVEELQASCAVALATLSQDCLEAVQRVCLRGGAKAVVAMLCRPLTPDTEGVAWERACECLAVLVSQGKGAMALPWEEVAVAVVGVMLLMPAAAAVQVAGCWALEEFAKQGAAAGASAVCEAGGHSAIVAAMRRKGASAAVLNAGCRALTALALAADAAGGRPLQSECLDVGAAEAVVLALRAAAARAAKAPKAAASGLRLSCAALEAL
ncbi:unnamed protein product, partial [Polarella glacialis]